METGKVILGVVAGIAVGALIGILVAPQKGETTRGQIADKGNDLADNIQEKLNTMFEGIANKFGIVTTEETSEKENVTEKAEQIKT
jgi:gas vesicle protein